MKVVFRTDASREIGSGHVMRCLNLAHGLRLRGATVSFIMRAHEGNLATEIMRSGFELTTLPIAKTGTQGSLGASWVEDAKQTSQLLEVVPDWLITDHYGIDDRWHRAIRPFTTRIMAIDDLANRLHDCDLLLDQNLSEQGDGKYTQLTPSHCVCLLGPRYALLGSEYSQLHDRCVPRVGAVRRLLVFFGGADRDGLCLRSLAALIHLKRSDLSVDMVAGSASVDFETLRMRALAHPNVRIHRALPSLAPLMVTADLFIGAGGSTSWQRLCLGLPSIVVTVADNQYPVTKLLAQRRLTQWLGDAEKTNAPAITAALSQWCNTGIPVSWFPDFGTLVDGRGVNRVCAALIKLGHEK